MNEQRDKTTQLLLQSLKYRYKDNVENSKSEIIKQNYFPLIFLPLQKALPPKVEMPIEPIKNYHFGAFSICLLFSFFFGEIVVYIYISMYIIFIFINNNIFKNRIKIYEQRITLYNKYQKIISNPKELNLYRNENLFNSISKSTVSTSIDTNDYRKGKTEKIFFNTLRREFGNKIQADKGIVLNYISGTPYLPDIVYQDIEKNIFIDIEIDEPYSLDEFEEAEPIHYETADDNRNLFFEENGWTVIRFAEEQIVYDSESCQKIIADVVHFLEKVVANKGKMNEVFELGLHSLNSVKQWTYSEALEMEEDKYRDKYLSTLKNKQNKSIGSTKTSILPAGIHIVKITDVKPYSYKAENKNGSPLPWVDPTYEAIVSMSNKDGATMMSLRLFVYKRLEDVTHDDVVKLMNDTPTMKKLGLNKATFKDKTLPECVALLFDSACVDEEGKEKVFYAVRKDNKCRVIDSIRSASEQLIMDQLAVHAGICEVGEVYESILAIKGREIGIVIEETAEGDTMIKCTMPIEDV
jgi:hypothetical protein